MAEASINWTPWHGAVQLREDLLNGDLALNQFAADLYEALMQRGKSPVYEDVDSFFALTFPAANLRELAGEVVQRLAGKTDKAIHQLALTYGGGKTHTMITLAHLVRNPGILPDVQSVREFRAAAGQEIPQARVAALCFDKIDVRDGLEAKAPSGEIRRFRYPWSILAWQIAGKEGIAELNLKNPEEERAEPPAEDPLNRLLGMTGGMPLLILVDEVLMYACTMVPGNPEWRHNLITFFQALTQAVSKAKRCCLVASLLSSDPKHNTELGMSLEAELANIFGRQQQGSIVSVTRDEVAEILRRRFFKPESIQNPAAFRVHVQKALQNMVGVDEHTRTHMAEQETLYGRNFPFHPELLEVFYAKWNSLPTFQRTRGLLRTFALALRDAAKWDRSPLIGPAVFLPAPGEAGLPPATQDLVSIADRAVTSVGQTKSAWGSILDTEISIAREADRAYGLKFRETEQAAVAVFLHSQPAGRDCPTSVLWPMLGTCRPQKIDLDKALRAWADTSFWLDDQLAGAGGIPEKWMLGAKPNLNQMHENQKSLLGESEKTLRLLEHLRKEKFLASGADPGVAVHVLPKSPADVADDGRFHFAVLGPEAACAGSKPSAFAARFLAETVHADAPRVHRNAVVLLAPSKDGVAATMERMADVMAWQKVREGLQKADGADQARLSSLASFMNAATGRLTETVKQAWCMAVTLNERGDPQSFKLTIGSAPSPFAAVKADPRSRVQSSAVNPEALLPGGPYSGIWGPGDQFRPVRDILGTFTRRPDMPKMLSSAPILETMKQGCLAGAFVLRLPRPNGTARTWWMDEPDAQAMADVAMELWLPESAVLESVGTDAVMPGSPLGIWPEGAEEIAVADAVGIFSGGKTFMKRDGALEEEFPVPRADRDVVLGAVRKAVESGMLWLLNPPASVLHEAVPAGALSDSAKLRLPPEPLSGYDVMPENLPDAWAEGRTSVSAVMSALSQKAGVQLPWMAVRAAVDAAISMRLAEIAPDSDVRTWPCSVGEAPAVVLRKPATVPPPSPIPDPVPSKPVPDVPAARFSMGPDGLFDLPGIAGKLHSWQGAHNASVKFEVSVFAEGAGHEAVEELKGLFKDFTDSKE